MHTCSVHRPYACSGSSPAASARRHGMGVGLLDPNCFCWFAYDHSPVNGTGVRLVLPAALDLDTYTRTPRPVPQSLRFIRFAPSSSDPTTCNGDYREDIEKY